MVSLTADDLLRVRELCERQDAAGRALTLLALALPETSGDELAGVMLGRRNAQLLALRERLFGSQLDAFAECPHCGEPLEFSLSAAALRGSPCAEQCAETELEVDGYTLRFRLLTTRDLAAAACATSPGAARMLLVERCLLEARQDGRSVAADELPETVIVRMAARMEECDPQAETLLDLVCPACEGEWQIAFDIASFLFTEVEAQALRLLWEVHTLARTYAWRETEILAMSPRRRRDYLEMVLQ